MKEFDEKEAVKAMRQALPPEASSRCNDDEDQGLLDIDAEADDDDVNVDALVAHVRKMIAKDKLSPIHPDEIEPIVAAELQYEQSLI